MEDRSPIQVLVRYAQIAGLLTTVGVLYVARDVLVPLFLGGLFSFALSPLVNRVKRLGCSNAVAVFCLCERSIFALVGVSVLPLVRSAASCRPGNGATG